MTTLTRQPVFISRGGSPHDNLFVRLSGAFERSFERLRESYSRLLGVLLRRRAVVPIVAMLMLGCNWASRFFYWTGGALLRHDWLFYTVAVVCLLRPRHARSDEQADALARVAAA